MTFFPEEVLEHIFSFLPSHQHRNSISLVSKTWFKVERLSRHRVFVGNCYALTPQRLIARFPRVRALTLKGKPHVADFNSVSPHWGCFVFPWIVALAQNCPSLQEIKLKRMVVSDNSLDLLSRSFPNFNSLVLVGCNGFTTDGLAAIASNCRLLEVLDLQENEVQEGISQWLSCFPESCTSLVSLNFASLKGQVDLTALEKLVARCPNLRSLRLNRTVPLDMLQKILVRAPQLVDLGIGSYVQQTRSESYVKLCNSVLNCKSVQNLSGFWEVFPPCLPAIYPVCWNLTSLNLSYARGIRGLHLNRLIRQCQKLQRLWILDCIGDMGLEVVANTCKDLQELRVFPSDPYNAISSVTEGGLVAISIGCPKLHSLLYFCLQMTNAALITIAKNCPNFTYFRLCILNPKMPDHITLQPLDEGFGAIVQSCKKLRRLSLSGFLTDKVFLYIGMYAEQLEMLSVAFAGKGDKGMLYVLNGCRNLRKLEIRDSPFDDAALLADVVKYERMRFLWISSCEVTLGGCKALAKKVPMLNVEIINEEDQMEENPDDSMKVEKMYLYRTLDGPRKDAPDFVWAL
ncbi:hypothetical protein L1049_005919 [Liquidambar formosana]|uniref:F-box domain-containing protein n=1 Tax=Liquidambar formosana TaxID=63359 RepID=A0AAP0WSG5_LIQFO